MNNKQLKEQAREEVMEAVYSWHGGNADIPEMGGIVDKIIDQATNTALDRALEAIAAKGNKYAQKYEKEDPLSDESSDLAMGMAICVELHKTIESLKEEL